MTASTSRRIDPAADLREARERNTQEARDEEVDRLAKAEADKAAASAARRLARAEAEAAERERLTEAARRQGPLLVTPLNTAPPPPEFEATTGGAGDEHPVMEREGSDVAMPDSFVPPPPPTSETRVEQPAEPPVLPAENVVVTDLTPQVRTPVRRHLEKAASAPRPLETGAMSSSVPDTEASSTAPTGWVRGGGTGTLNQAPLDIQAKLRAEVEALRRCNEAFLDSRVAIRVSLLLLLYFDLLSSFVGARQRTHWV